MAPHFFIDEVIVVNAGWIKLHRTILDNPTVKKSPEHLAIWVWLLLNATHSNRDVIFGGKRKKQA